MYGISAAHHAIQTARDWGQSMARDIDRGRRIQGGRLAAGLSQQQLADRCNTDIKTVRNWEKGVHRPQQGSHESLARALKVSTQGLLQLLEDESSSRPSPSEPIRGDKVDGTYKGAPVARQTSEGRSWAHGANVSAAVAAALAMPTVVQDLFGAPLCPWETGEAVRDAADEIGAELERQYAVVGGAAICEAAVAIHHRVAGWLRDERHRPQVEQALEAFCGELCTWIGWVALDAGRPRLAETSLQEAMLHSRLAQCVVSEVCALNNLSVLHIRGGDPHRAKKIIGLALQLTPDHVPPRLQSLLHLRAAVASGYLGDDQGFEEHALHARRAFDQGERDDEPTWFRSFSEAEIRGLLGWGRLALGRASQAADDFLYTSQSVSSVSQRAWLHYRVQHARAIALQGAHAEAAQVGVEIGAEVLAIHSSPIQADFRSLVQELARQSCPESLELVAMYHQLWPRGDLLPQL